MSFRDYISATERELAEWPGATYEQAPSGKHVALTVRYRGMSRKVIIPRSPSDGARGVQNHLATMRRELNSLGAKRIERRKSTTDRVRNKPVRPPIFTIDAKIPASDPFAVLGKLKERITMSYTDRVLDLVRSAPGLNAREIATLLPDIKYLTVASTLSYACKSGRLSAEKKIDPNHDGQNKWALYYTYNDTPAPPRPSQAVKPKDDGEVKALRVRVAELEAWKKDAIARFPDLDVDPVVAEARKLVAGQMDNAADAEQVRLGRRDSTLPMRVAIEALSR